MEVQRVSGLHRVVAGYTGGKHPDPTYDDLFDHTEAVWIEYDPTVVSYRELLEHWFQLQPNPYIAQPDRQYRSVLWYQTQQQYEEASAFLKDRQSRDRRLYSTIEPAGTFYRAEEYHQDYLDKHTGGIGFFL